MNQKNDHTHELALQRHDEIGNDVLTLLDKLKHEVAKMVHDDDDIGWDDVSQLCYLRDEMADLIGYCQNKTDDEVMTELGIEKE